MADVAAIHTPTHAVSETACTSNTMTASTTEDLERLLVDQQPNSCPQLQQQHQQQPIEVSPMPPQPLSPAFETCDSPSTSSAAVDEDDKSGIIKQAWMAVQALSSASCSHTLQPEQPGVCDNDTQLGAIPIEIHSASSQDEDTMDERESSEEGVLEYKPPHENSVLGIKVSGNHLYSCSSDKSIKVYDVHSCQEVKRHCLHRRSVTCIEVFTYGTETYVVSGSSDKHIIMSNAKTGEIEIDFNVGARVMCMLSRDSLLVAGLSNGYVHLINLETKSAQGKCLVGENPERRDISCLCIYHNTLFTACYANTISCWDISDYTAGVSSPSAVMRKIGQIKCFEKFVLCMQVGEGLLYCGSADATLKVFSTKTWKAHAEVKGHNGAVSGLCLSGNLLITSCFDKFIRCFDTKNMALLQVYAIEDLPFTLCTASETVFYGLRDGRVISFKIDLSQYHQCQVYTCT
jgi:WD40 repeat protein